MTLKKKKKKTFLSLGCIISALGDGGNFLLHRGTVRMKQAIVPACGSFAVVLGGGLEQTKP